MWEKKNGNNHTQVEELVDVLDGNLEVEAGLSMLVSDKKALGGNKSKTSLSNKKYKANCLPKNRIYLEIFPTYIYFFNA